MSARLYIRPLYFIIILLVIIAGIVGIADIAMAQSYTTRMTATNSSSTNSEAVKCSSEDIRIINKFDRKAKRNLKEALEDFDIGDNRALKETENSVKIKTKAVNFFSSDEYIQMMPVYERCGKNIPVLYNAQTPFWFPDQNDGSPSCPSCSKR